MGHLAWKTKSYMKIVRINILIVYSFIYVSLLKVFKSIFKRTDLIKPYQKLKNIVNSASKKNTYVINFIKIC